MFKVVFRDFQASLLTLPLCSSSVLRRLIRQFLKVTSIWPAPAPGGLSSSLCCQSPSVQGCTWAWLWPSLPTCPKTTNGKGDYSRLAEPSWDLTPPEQVQQGWIFIFQFGALWKWNAWNKEEASAVSLKNISSVLIIIMVFLLRPQFSLRKQTLNWTLDVGTIKTLNSVPKSNTSLNPSEILLNLKTTENMNSQQRRGMMPSTYLGKTTPYHIWTSAVIKWTEKTSDVWVTVSFCY